MMELTLHTFAKPKKSVPWDALMYETALLSFCVIICLKAQCVEV